MSLFHQRQQGSYCRYHSINNLLGRQICTTIEFDKYCDELDSKNNFTVKCSKNSQEFYNNGNDDNIFGYTMKKKGINVRMTGYDFHRKLDIKLDDIDLEDLLGAFAMVNGHVYCVRYYNDIWHVIDSLNGRIVEVPFSYFNNKKIAFIFVWLELDILTKI